MALSYQPATFPIQQQRLQQFFNRAISTVLFFTLVDSSIFVSNQSHVNGLNVLSDFGLLAMLGIAYVLMRHGRLRLSVILVSLACSVFALLFMLISPMSLFLALFLPTIGIATSLSYVDSRTLRYLSVGAWLATILVVLIPRYVHLSGWVPTVADPLLVLFVTTVVVGIVLFFLHEAHQRLNEALDQTLQANTALQEARSTLEDTVVRRTSDLRQALAEVEARAAEQQRLLDEIQHRDAVIREMSVPVLPVTDQIRVIPLIGVLDSQRLVLLETQALQTVAHPVVCFLVLDITGVPVIDSQVAGGIMRIVNAAGLLGTEVMLVGINPEVAQAIVALGMNLDGLRTAATLQDSLATLLNYA